MKDRFSIQAPDIYQQAIQTLLEKGLAYRCYSTEAELDECPKKEVRLPAMTIVTEIRRRINRLL